MREVYSKKTAFLAKGVIHFFKNSDHSARQTCRKRFMDYLSRHRKKINIQLIACPHVVKKRLHFDYFLYSDCHDEDKVREFLQAAKTFAGIAYISMKPVSGMKMIQDVSNYTFKRHAEPGKQKGFMYLPAKTGDVLLWTTHDFWGGENLAERWEKLRKQWFGKESRSTIQKPEPLMPWMDLPVEEKLAYLLPRKAEEAVSLACLEWLTGVPEIFLDIEILKQPNLREGKRQILGRRWQIQGAVVGKTCL